MPNHLGNVLNLKAPMKPFFNIKLFLLISKMLRLSKEIFNFINYLFTEMIELLFIFLTCV